MSLPDGYVLPKPGIPKTMGILSIVLAVMGLLYGLCVAVSTVFFAPIMDGMNGIVKKAQEPVRQQIQARIDALDAQEKAATTEPEKASIKQQRGALEAQKELSSGNPGMEIAKQALNDPSVRLVAYLNLFMIVGLGLWLLYAGIGLIKLKESGRKAGVVWAGVALGWLLVFMVLEFAVVLPAQKPLQDKQMALMDAQFKKMNNPGMPDMAQLSKVTQVVTTVGLVIGFGVAAIYPTIMLIMLNGAGTRAACQAKPTLDPFGVA